MDLPGTLELFVKAKLICYRYGPKHIRILEINLSKGLIEGINT